MACGHPLAARAVRVYDGHLLRTTCWACDIEGGRRSTLGVPHRELGEYHGHAGTSSQVASSSDAVPLLVPGGAASSRYEGRD